MSRAEWESREWDIFKPERTTKLDLSAHLFHVTRPAKDLQFRHFTEIPPSKEYRKINISQEKRYWWLKDKLDRLFWKTGKSAVKKESQGLLDKFLWWRKKAKKPFKHLQRGESSLE